MPVFRLEDYGGGTGPAADNTVAWAQILALGGYSVWIKFEAGEYIFNGPVKFKSGMRLSGECRAFTTLKASFTGSLLHPEIQGERVYDPIIEDLTIINLNGIGIYWSSVTNGYIQRCRFIGPGRDVPNMVGLFMDGISYDNQFDFDTHHLAIGVRVRTGRTLEDGEWYAGGPNENTFSWFRANSCDMGVVIDPFVVPNVVGGSHNINRILFKDSKFEHIKRYGVYAAPAPNTVLWALMMDAPRFDAPSTATAGLLGANVAKSRITDAYRSGCKPWVNQGGATNTITEV